MSEYILHDEVEGAFRQGGKQIFGAWSEGARRNPCEIEEKLQKEKKK